MADDRLGVQPLLLVVPLRQSRHFPLALLHLPQSDSHRVASVLSERRQQHQRAVLPDPMKVPRVRRRSAIPRNR